MKKFIWFLASASLGVGVTWMSLQPSFASGSHSQLSPLTIGPKCAAKVGPARFTVGDRCFRDEVMVGRWDDNIYCANIEIICD